MRRRVRLGTVEDIREKRRSTNGRPPRPSRRRTGLFVGVVVCVDQEGAFGGATYLKRREEYGAQGLVYPD